MSLWEEGLLRQAAARQWSAEQKLVPGSPEGKMNSTIDYIHSHLDQDLSLSKLASIAKISLYHFARQFKQTVGAPPHQYVIQCRIERAKQLLTNKDLSITEITQKVGFQSQSHFTSLFRHSVGLTPSAYRNQL